jgi:hypothetical protein
MRAIFQSTVLRHVAAIITIAALLGGCANQNSIFRRTLADGRNPTVMTADAKQRHLVVVPPYGRDSWKVCAEAAPDVFSALSTSAAGNLGFSQNGSQTDAQAKAALAIAEAAGTIERTQTINLLRESMYRTCERYLSGAIDSSAFVVQAGRDWRAMIAILAIEQLTRAARPPATLISAGPTSASVQEESDALRQLSAAQASEDQARTAKQAADQDVAANCATVTDANKAACDAKKVVASDAADVLARATHQRESWEGIAKSYGQNVGPASTTGAGTVNAGGFGAPSTADLATISSAVYQIVHEAFATDETQLFCIQAVDKPVDSTLRSDCLTYLIDKVRTERASLFASPAVQQQIGVMDAAMRSTRVKAADYLRSLDDASYAGERTAIAAKLGSFCDGLSRQGCIASVLAGEADPVAVELSAIIDQRIQARSRP